MNDCLSALTHCRVILVGTTHPGNIGAAARAMKTMGLTHLTLVAPEADAHDPIAVARASGADDVLARAHIVPTLAQALASTVASLALTARAREWSVPPRPLRAAVQDACALAHAGAEIALVFGPERSGLDNAAVQMCTQPVTVPTSAEYSSLNLAAAVQLACYELRMAALADAPEAVPEPASPWATAEEVEGLHAHLLAAMTQCGFFDPTHPRQLPARLRRLFGRVRLEREEINILRGLLTAMGCRWKKQ